MAKFTMNDALKIKRLNRLSWDELAEGLPIKGNSLRVAFNRGSVPDAYLEIIAKNNSDNVIQPVYEESQIEMAINKKFEVLIDPVMIRISALEEKFKKAIKENFYRNMSDDEVILEIREELSSIKMKIQKKLG